MRLPRPIRSWRKKIGPDEIEPDQDRHCDHHRKQGDQHGHGERDIERALLGAAGKIERPARDDDSRGAAHVVNRERPEFADLGDDDLALDVGALQHLRPFDLALGHAAYDNAVIVPQQSTEPIEHVRVIEIRAQRRRLGVDNVAAQARIRYISAIHDNQFGVQAPGIGAADEVAEQHSLADDQDHRRDDSHRQREAGEAARSP